MKDALITALIAFCTWTNTARLTWWQRIVAIITAAAIGLAVMLFMPACMVTTELEGKTYSTRFDILTPIMPTTTDPGTTTTIRTAPAKKTATQPPTSQPAS